MTAVLGLIIGCLLAGLTSAQVTCKNKFNDKDCEVWATRGECINTPDFMLVQCAQSCGSCDTIPTPSPSISLIPPRIVPMPYFLVQCEDPAKMECPSGYAMTVTSANFGRQSDTACLDEAGTMDTVQGCFDDSILPLIKSACDGLETCDYEVPPSYINNDVCPGIHKYLNVSFTCAETQYKGLRCDEESLRLQCRDKVILVYDAMYGRQDIDTCRNEADPSTTSCSAPDAFTRISQLCNYKHFCDVTATIDLLDDPCPGTSKYLDLTFSCMECKNIKDDMACELWTERGECGSNTGWMMANCRKACTGCHLAASCVNALGDDQRCNDWAATGECLSNPKFMHAQCQRSCNRCQNPILMPSPQLKPRGGRTTKSPGKCTCDSIKWTGVLCKKCAPGYQGDMCEAIPTKRPPTPDARSQQTTEAFTQGDRFEPSSTETSASTSRSTHTPSTSASSTSSSTASSTPAGTPTPRGPAAPAIPDIVSSARPRIPPRREQDVNDGVRVPAGGVSQSDAADKKYTGMSMEATVARNWRPEYTNDNSGEYESFADTVIKRLENFYKGHFPHVDHVLLLGLQRGPPSGALSSTVLVTYYLEFRQPITEVDGLKVECAISEETDQEIYVYVNNAYAALSTNKSTNQLCAQKDTYCGANGAYARKATGEKYCKCKDGYRGARCSSIPEWVIIVVVVVSCVCSLALIIIICICVNRKKSGDHEKGHMGAESIKTAKSHMSAPMSHVSVVSSKGGARPKMLTERHPSGHYNSYY